MSWIKEKYWDLKEWWFFRKSPIRKSVEIPGFEVTEIEGIRLIGVHAKELCAGRACVIHSPTEHHMRSSPLHWRDDRGIFERICEHGIGHPDPDQFAYWNSLGRKGQGIGVHGCDGCCVPEEDKEKPWMHVD